MIWVWITSEMEGRGVLVVHIIFPSVTIVRYIILLISHFIDNDIWKLS